MTQPRPDGPMWHVDAVWIEWLTRRMREVGMSQRRLGKAVGASGAAISDLIAGKSGQSRLLPAINAVLGGQPPTQRTVDQRTPDEIKDRIDGKWDHLDAAERKLVADLVDRLSRNK